MLGRAAQTDHRLLLWGPNGPLSGLEQVPSVLVSEPHHEVQADAEEGRPQCEEDHPGDARRKQDRGDEYRSDRHHHAAAQEACHGLAPNRSSHVGAIIRALGGHIV